MRLDLSQSCKLWGNDIGWNDNNAIEESSIDDNMWYNNVTDVGNWWSDYSGAGVYYVSNGTHAVYPDMYPSKSLHLVQPAPIEFEILELGNSLEFEASALNPSHYKVFLDGYVMLEETWDGGNIEVLVEEPWPMSHGLHTIELEVYHISGHSLRNSSTANVEDLTPPDIVGPTHVTITVGDALSVQYHAADPSGVASWTVNDTVNFAIANNIDISSGLLTSITDLLVGEYIVRITVTDTHGHSSFRDVTISVNAAPDDGLPTTMILLAGAGGAVVIIVVLVVILKKKQT
jgi:hypothetical protein